MERQHEMDEDIGMAKRLDSQAGAMLIETLVAMVVLTAGAVGMASVFLYGIQSASSGPNELVATQKAAEAVESVFSARDSHAVTWDQLRNASGGGIFLDGPQEMRLAGDDGILNTNDDAAEPIESTMLPGKDQDLQTASDNTEVTLTSFRREIAISELSSVLREITVVITYQAGTVNRSYTLTALISAYA